MDRNLSPHAYQMIATRFRVLSEPIRLRLLNTIRDGELTVSELTAELQTSQPNVSKHLKMLTDSGILRREQKGNAVFYSIEDPTIFKLCEVVCDSLSRTFKKQADLFVTA